jgi:hypothetical protein
MLKLKKPADERGVSVVLGATLVIGIIITILSAFLAAWIPREQERLAREHALGVRDSFEELQLAIEELEEGGMSEVVEVKMNPDPVPYFGGVTEAGELSAEPLVYDTQEEYSYLRSCIADAYVNENNPDSNFGDSTGLVVAFVSDYEYQSFLMFDLENLASGASSGTIAISSVRLRLYCSTIWFAGDWIGVYGVENDDWLEDEITWNDKPYITRLLDENEVKTSPQWYSWDVTSFVLDQYQGDGEASFCLKLLSLNGDRWIGFGSKDGSSNRPKLEVDFRYIPPSTTYVSDNINIWGTIEDFGNMQREGGYATLMEEEFKATTYDFEDSVNNKAWYDYDRGNSPYSPPPTANAATQEMYDNAENDDSSFWITSGAREADESDYQYYKFVIQETPSEIEDIIVKWIGYNTLAYNIKFRAWNENSTSWVLLDSGGAGSENTFENDLLAIDDNVYHWLKNDNEVWLSTEAPAGAGTLYTDYVEVKVTPKVIFNPTMEIEMIIENVLPGNVMLEMKYQRNNTNDHFKVKVLEGGSNWNYRGDDLTTVGPDWGLWSYRLEDNEIAENGEVRVKIVDADPEETEFTDLQIDYLRVRVVSHSGSVEFQISDVRPTQTYVYEDGAVILVQGDRDLMIFQPSMISVSESEGDNIRVDVHHIVVSGLGKSTSEQGTCSIRAEAKRSEYIVRPFGKPNYSSVDVVIYSNYENVWVEYLRSVWQELEASGGFGVSPPDESTLTLTIDGKGEGGENDIYYYEKVTEIEIRLV